MSEIPCEFCGDIEDHPSVIMCEPCWHRFKPSAQLLHAVEVYELRRQIANQDHAWKELIAINQRLRERLSAASKTDLQ